MRAEITALQVQFLKARLRRYHVKGAVIAVGLLDVKSLTVKQKLTKHVGIAKPRPAPKPPPFTGFEHPEKPTLETCALPTAKHLNSP